MKRILFAGGGTGGHLYPGLALAERLRSEGVEVEFVGTRKGVEAEVVPRHGFAIRFVRAGRFSRKPLHLVRGVLETTVGFIQCLVWLLSRRPGLVVGTGGYASAPVGLASAVLGVPLLVLEQNAVPGKVTRLLARFARRACVSFPETLRWLPSERAEVTGNPIRPEILACTREEGRRRLGLDLQRPCLLVTGASQGAESLNRAVLRSLSRWSQRGWSVVHLTGPKNLAEVVEAAAALVRDAPLRYQALGYLDDMAAAYAAADLVVCRAGATTLAEVTARGLA
ncbi:MAG: UDP-N-acetylglucosamine--N-acetylmuramyl-(pentapeptide) pyrophosphoryl-undecaprenol N-acetylglucosamine transferase, partial [Candidatus Eremiobacterota bacterium]